MRRKYLSDLWSTIIICEAKKIEVSYFVPKQKKVLMKMT
jgi:hypothetical protein